MNFLASFVQFLVLIPAALLCYLPMKTKLRYSPARTAGLFGLVYLFFIPAAAWILTIFHIGANAVMFPVIAIFFLFYWKTLNVSLSQGTCCLYPSTAPCCPFVTSILLPLAPGSIPMERIWMFFLILFCFSFLPLFF